ncbi:DNA translocase FtsK [Gemella sp. zg-1178]|uniref:DNA translocase FtsK n=1 Tax=Gemella sp. zg-1178 TaxID=2840372 RepID=UPI0035303A7F
MSKNRLKKNKKIKSKKKSTSVYKLFLNFKENNTSFYNFFIYIVLIAITTITTLRMGWLGQTFDNFIKYLLGSSSYILYLIVFSSVIFSIFKKSLHNKIYVVVIIFLFSLILELFFYKSSNYNLFSYFYVSENYNSFLGGGKIFYFQSKLVVYLLSYYGALILAISLFIFTIIMYINKLFPDKISSLITSISSKKNLYLENEEVEFTKELDEADKINTYYDEIKDIDLEISINDFKKEDLIKEDNLKDNNYNTSKKEEKLNYEAVNDYEHYTLPPLSLLKDPVENKKISKEDIVNKSKILKNTFKNFGVEVKIVKAIVGPSITQFQIMPTPGTKVSKIINLSNDISLNLAAKDVRIEAPIPGKSLIGIEIPNSVNQLVTMKEVFVNGNDASPLSVTLGKDVSGESIFARLDKMPHLLVAGSTGSGKSVCINTIITSILLKNKPDKVKLIMIDPKMVELSIYDGIPHLLTPVVTNPLKAADVLYKVVLEMERRYKEFSIARVKNIEGYNKIAQEDEEYKELPYIVIIIDELADLMLVASKEVEESIARITQMARAAGIHLIIATQRPSVDVITGVIKSNIPSRISFAVSSSIDSRTILDKAGAETLLGRGDMLFQSAESSKPVRLQGAFLSDLEVENIVDFIKNQSKTDYDPSMKPSENSLREAGKSDEVDPLYKEVLLFIAKTQKASASLLQRRFKIGYNRAARIIETLEEDGYIGAADGSKPRKVFLEPEFAENNQ